MSLGETTALGVGGGGEVVECHAFYGRRKCCLSSAKGPSPGPWWGIQLSMILVTLRGEVAESRKDGEGQRR